MIEALFTLVDVIVVGNLNGMVGTFSDVISPTIGAAVGLYIVWLGYQSFYDTQSVIILDVMKTIGSLAVVTFIAFNTPWYLDNMVPIVLYSGDDITTALLGNVGSSGAASLQTIFDAMLNQTVDLWNSVDFGFDADLIVNAILVGVLIILTWVGFIPFLAISTGYLLVAKVMVSFVLILGPLFVMFAFFPSTRDFFKAWTRECFNYVLLTVVYPLAFSLFVKILDETVMASNISLPTVLVSVLILWVLLLLSVQIPAFCSTLSGGVGINGLVGANSSAVSNVMSMITNTKKGASAVASKVKDVGKGKINPG